MDILKGLGSLGASLIFNDITINIFSGSQPINTKEEAIEKGRLIMFRKYPFRNLDRYIIRAYDDEDHWYVFTALIDENTGHMLKGGGGPSVTLRKMDGKITDSTISQR